LCTDPSAIGYERLAASGAARFIYLLGLGAGWTALGLALGTWANWRFVARRLRVLSRLADVPGISSNASGDVGQAKTGNRRA
jgi:hypothetical protein